MTDWRMAYFNTTLRTWQGVMKKNAGQKGRDSFKVTATRVAYIEAISESFRSAGAHLNRATSDIPRNTLLIPSSSCVIPNQNCTTPLRAHSEKWATPSTHFPHHKHGLRLTIPIGQWIIRTKSGWSRSKFPSTHASRPRDRRRKFLHCLRAWGLAFRNPKAVQQGSDSSKPLLHVLCPTQFICPPNARQL